MTDPKKRFWSKVGPVEENGCRIWQASRDRQGYGRFKLNSLAREAHRVSFFLHHGRWPNGETRHICDNRACCEPSHLIDGTHKQNMEDAACRGRMRSPRPGNGVQRLRSEDYETICRRFKSGETNKSALAREYGISRAHLRNIVSGRVPKT